MSINAPRVSRATRLRTQLVAEKAIQEYAGVMPETGVPNFALWHYHVHGARLDPMQVVKMTEMWRNPNTIDVSCRRTRKTSTKELYCLQKLATRPFQNEGIVAPRVQQSMNNLLYHLEAIDRSDMLKAYIDYRNGRMQKSDTSYRFANKSGADCYGIMSQVDGDSLTIASLEETDDMPHDRLFSRFMPMLGAAERLGQDPSMGKLDPDVRITGVFKGADVLQTMIDGGQYILLPEVDVYLGLRLGIISAPWAAQMKAEQTPEEWIRQFLCLNRAAKNFIWEKHLRWAISMGIQAGLSMAEPMPGMQYRKRGLVSFGYDHLGHGESETASESCLVVVEQLGGWLTIVYVRFWPAHTDDTVIARDLVSAWAYFNPDAAIGDAYGVGMLTTVNDKLFEQGLTPVDRRTIGGGASVASTWAEWPFAPIRFEGMVKHSMATILRSAIHGRQFAVAAFDEVVHGSPGTYSLPISDASQAFVKLTRQMTNMKAVVNKSKTSYASYQMVNRKVGDDGFDAAMAAAAALVNRTGLDITTMIEMTTRTRDQLLGPRVMPAGLLASRLGQQGTRQ